MSAPPINASTPTLVIATHNRGKAHEIRKILGDIPWRLISLNEFDGIGSAEEIEPTYAGNAIAKAKYYASWTGKVVLADDSGLEVEALDGAPGVLSARYAGPEASDYDRRVKLLDELSGTQNRKARFVCAVAIATAKQEILTVAHGVCPGSITREPHGDSGFGYDPLFVPDGYEQTFGELPETLKNEISHRGRALEKVREYLLGKSWTA